MTYPALQLLIDNETVIRTSSAETLPVFNPATDEILGHLPIAGPKELQRAVEAAGRGFALWSTMLPVERFRIITRATGLIRERAKDIATILTLEQGKPLPESLREVQLAADIIDFLGEEGKRLGGRSVPPRVESIQSQIVERIPVGPVAAFTPWNFPANLPARKIGGALGAGCSVIIKPSEETPATCIEIVKAFIDAGLPRGVLNLVCGRPAEISSTLIAHPGIAKISFTGSVPVGKALAELAARHLKRYTAELGGHAPVVVCQDVDPAAIVAACVAAKFRNAGQVCASPVRFIVHSSVYAAFKDGFVAGAKALKIGSGLDTGVQFGPLIDSRRVKEMHAFVQDAVAHGARVLCGGRAVERAGAFFEPTVLENVPLQARAQREEPFGPIALLEPFDELETAIRRANSLPYGLAAYAFTNDLHTSQELGRKLQAGMVGINHFGISQPETPFGGIKESGLGSESGLEGLLAYTDVKLVSIA